MQILADCNQNSPNFMSRCSSIRMAQDICHSVNKQYQCLSSSKFSPMYDTFLKTYRYAGTNTKTKNGVNVFKVRDAYIKLQESIDNIRMTHSHSIFDLACSIACTRKGNCNEIAAAALYELIINGIQNPMLASLKTEENGYDFDHVFCVFNRDGSSVTKIKNNNTIIVDPWLNDVDFANNMIKKYTYDYSKWVKLYQYNKPVTNRNQIEQQKWKLYAMQEL
ncbi:MAG: hypothetical protein MJ237_05120 [bacterium]|nr:hypothetical protein [bacterium]